jgi:hypothetical protein
MPELTAEELALIEAGAAVDDESDEVDEILAELKAQQTINDSRYTELTERITQCLSRLEILSQGANSENPVLTQLSNQIAGMKVEITAALKSLEDTSQRNLEQSVSPPIETVETVQDLPSLEELTEEPSEESAELKQPRKNRFL